jgi:hypothetical protein
MSKGYFKSWQVFYSSQNDLFAGRYNKSRWCEWNSEKGLILRACAGSFVKIFN